LANIYLNPVDQAFERNGIGNIEKGSIHIVRYADDILILAQNNLERGINLLEHYVDRLGLNLNKEKTRRLNLKEDKKLEFLGFEFIRTKSWRTNKRLILLRPSPKSQKKCREKIRRLINQKIPLKAEDQIKGLNQYLTGWTNYFRLGNSSKALSQISHYVDKRVRRLLQRQKGGSGYGWNKINREYVYGKLGLFGNYKVQSLYA
jgi:hypothetical protein